MDLGLERAGIECAWQVENNEFCQKILTKHWPDVPKYGNIRDVGRKNLEKVDLIAGGFPCQPFSDAGKRRGTEDDRHLWPEMLRVIRELRPTWVLGENVPGIIKIFLDQAITDLEGEGYTCEPLVLPAVGFDADHKRHRPFIVAYSNITSISESRGTRTGRAKSSDSGIQRKRKNSYNWLPEPAVGRVAHGVPNRVDRLKGLGNAVVPQVAEHIGNIIMTANALC